jgi:hypothetical protein
MARCIRVVRGVSASKQGSDFGTVEPCIIDSHSCRDASILDHMTELWQSFSLTEAVSQRESLCCEWHGLRRHDAGEEMPARKMPVCGCAVEPATAIHVPQQCGALQHAGDRTGRALCAGCTHRPHCVAVAATVLWLKRRVLGDVSTSMVAGRSGLPVPLRSHRILAVVLHGGEEC